MLRCCYPEAPDFRLEDDDETVAMSSLEGRTVILFFGDQRGGKETQEWLAELKETRARFGYDQVEAIYTGDWDGAPSEDLKSDTVRIIRDTDAIRERYGGVPTEAVFLIDGSGRLRLRMQCREKPYGDPDCLGSKHFLSTLSALTTEEKGQQIVDGSRW